MKNGPHCDNDEPFLVLLRTTPTKTVCPNFYLFDHARGCNFNCSYCFLRDSEYDKKERRIFVNTDALYEQLGEWVCRDDLETYLANAGNMTDAFSFERERPLWGGLIEFMREHAERKHRPHTLLAVTKAGLEHCGAFLECEPCRNIIISFSINAAAASRDHEVGAASMEERVKAAATLKRLGWRVRVRIDPMIKGYDYGPVTEAVYAISPERVTLGTLRADPTLLPEVGAVSIFTELDPPEDEGIARYPLSLRLALYGPVVERLRPVTSLGLCEETEEVWQALGLDYLHKTCNCNPV